MLALLLPLRVYPQFKESFQGPEVASANPWTGDLDGFAVGEGWLLSRADAARNRVSIETPLFYSPTMEWEFEVRMDFKPTDPNHIRLHVYLDDPGTPGARTDYYVQVGSNKQTITFRRQAETEKSPRILIEEALAALSGAVSLRVRLTLENRETWNLYVLEEDRFVWIGSCESGVSASCEGGPLRLECRYTKTRVNGFACNYIVVSDTISIEPERPHAPEEPGAPDLPAEPEEPEAPDVPDLPAEPEAADTPSLPAGGIRINEVMADPKGQQAFPETEYVELYNATDKAVALAGWSFVYGGKPTVLTASLLDAGGYVVLYRSGRELAIDDPGQALPLDKFPASLANAGKELALLDPSGREIDRVAYEPARAGIAWERTGAGFYLSTDERGGTPGSANSSPAAGPDDPDRPGAPAHPVLPAHPAVLPREIVFNELLPNPYPEGSEYIELYNRSDRALPLAGLSIATRRADGTLSARYPLSSITSSLEPRDYVLLTKKIEGVSGFYLIASPGALRELKLPVLANTSATLVLFRTGDEAVIDEVRYTAQWHAPSVRNEKGVALERIHPDRDTQDEANWTSASAPAGYGTPGYRNSQYSTPDEGEVTGIEPPVYSEATKEYAIPYRLDEAGYTCRAWIFDTSGRRICEVVNQDLLGTEGELTWNGRAANGSKVRTGVYIFYAELAHPRGQVKRYKEVFLAR